MLILDPTTSDYLVLDPSEIEHLILTTEIQVIVGGDFPEIEGYPLSYIVIHGSSTGIEVQGNPLSYPILKGK